MPLASQLGKPSSKPSSELTQHIITPRRISGDKPSALAARRKSALAAINAGPHQQSGAASTPQTPRQVQQKNSAPAGTGEVTPRARHVAKTTSNASTQSTADTSAPSSPRPPGTPLHSPPISPRWSFVAASLPTLRHMQQKNSAPVGSGEMTPKGRHMAKLKTTGTSADIGKTGMADLIDQGRLSESSAASSPRFPGTPDSPPTSPLWRTQSTRRSTSSRGALSKTTAAAAATSAGAAGFEPRPRKLQPIEPRKFQPIEPLHYPTERKTMSLSDLPHLTELESDEEQEKPPPLFGSFGSFRERRKSAAELDQEMNAIIDTQCMAYRERSRIDTKASTTSSKSMASDCLAAAGNYADNLVVQQEVLKKLEQDESEGLSDDDRTTDHHEKDSNASEDFSSSNRRNSLTDVMVTAAGRIAAKLSRIRRTTTELITTGDLKYDMLMRYQMKAEGIVA
mmetsp:Transcript_47445/g.86871  ORF Transcript_47445/g.86871 Transcript_47445/m.86871 type:complete len:453 (+) Transcript_47445:92-1450(+)